MNKFNAFDYVFSEYTCLCYVYTCITETRSTHVQCITQLAFTMQTFGYEADSLGVKAYTSLAISRRYIVDGNNDN